MRRASWLAFAPGPTQHTIYLANDFSERWPDLMARLGKHRASKVCLYLTVLWGGGERWVSVWTSYFFSSQAAGPKAGRHRPPVPYDKQFPA